MVDERYIVNIKGTNFVKYEGLLNEAHNKGILCLEVTIIQFPSADNGKVCICRACLVGTDHQSFADYGDAGPESVDQKIIPHIIRMAATRAKARVLRDFTNIGMCSLEEIQMCDLNDSTSEPVTPAQMNLLKKLATELKLDINFKALDKQKASKLIDELSSKKKAG